MNSSVILVVAAHPDDEVLGCGGTMAKLAESGEEVCVAILGEGATSRYESREQARADEIKRLQEHSRAVAKLLGARVVALEGLPDNRFDTVPLLDIVKKVEGLVKQYQPHAIYTHHPGDLNIDHALTFRAVMTATRPVSGCPVSEIYTFEVASSTEWAFQRFEPAFRPNVFVDVSAFLDKKIHGMGIYESEARPFPHPRSAEALRVQARRWGAAVGLAHAEAFELVRAIRP